MRCSCLFIILLTVSISQTVAAQVPHQFENNTPAVAAEVNENFDHLVNAIEAVETNVGTLETNQTAQGLSIQAINSSIDDLDNNSGTNTADIVSLQSQLDDHLNQPFIKLDNINLESHDSYTYTATPATIGDEITNSGYEFRIVRVPFKELGTGTNYSITFAAHCGTDCAGFNNVFITSYHVKAEGTGSLTIDSYPAYIRTKDQYSQAISPNAGQVQLQLFIQNFVYIRVNETLILVTYTVQSSAFSATAETADFINDANLINYNDTVATTTQQYVDTLIDYIDIAPIP